MNNLVQLTKLYDDYKKKIERFDKNYNDLENLLRNAGNYENSQKVVFIGRGGSTKSALLSELINISMPDTQLNNGTFIEYNVCNENNSSNSQCFSQDKSKLCLDNNYTKLDSCLHINLPKSRHSVLNTITILDTPLYNYSDELDKKIVENCKEANIFVLVLSAVGSIGDLDKRFLQQISKNVFVNRLIFIFTNMENVPENEIRHTTGQHKSNACRIANEILRVPQPNIPIFFVRNNKLELGRFLPHLENFNLTPRDEEDICENVREILGNLREIIENEQSRVCKEIDILKTNITENQRTNDKVAEIENCELYSQKSDLMNTWRDNIKLSKFRVDKKKDFSIFSTLDSEKTKEVIENKLQDFTKKCESENSKIPENIISIIVEFVKLFDYLIHFNKKFDTDHIRSLPNKYDEMVDFANKNIDIDGKLFDRLSIILVDIELALLLILIYLKKWKMRMKLKAQKRQKRKVFLRFILSKISSSKIKNKNNSNIDSKETNHVTKSINNEKDVLDNSNRILGEMLGNINLMIKFDRNEIFVNAMK